MFLLSRILRFCQWSRLHGAARLEHRVLGQSLYCSPLIARGKNSPTFADSNIANLLNSVEVASKATNYEAVTSPAWDELSQGVPTMDSDGLHPGLSAFVESAISKRTPFAQLLQASNIRSPTIYRFPVDFEVSGVDHYPLRRMQDNTQAFRNRVGDWRHLYVEWPNLESLSITKRVKRSAILNLASIAFAEQEPS